MIVFRRTGQTLVGKNQGGTPRIEDVLLVQKTKQEVNQRFMKSPSPPPPPPTTTKIANKIPFCDTLILKGRNSQFWKRGRKRYLKYASKVSTEREENSRNFGPSRKFALVSHATYKQFMLNSLSHVCIPEDGGVSKRGHTAHEREW